MNNVTPLKVKEAETSSDIPSKEQVKRHGYIYAIANQKGGVGKTTTAVNLSAALAKRGFKTLLVDLDPQGNASTGVGIELDTREITIYEALIDNNPIDECIMSTEFDGLDILPSSADLAGAEIQLIHMQYREFCLKTQLDSIRHQYDFIIIDCPPSLSLLTLNGLIAASSVVIPLQSEFFALEGLSHLLRTLELVRQKFNPDLSIAGVLLTMFDRRNNLSYEVAEDVKQVLGAKVYETFIPRNVRISEAPSHGMPVISYDKNSRGAKAYFAYCDEFLSKIDNDMLDARNGNEKTSEVSGVVCDRDDILSKENASTIHVDFARAHNASKENEDKLLASEVVSG